MGVNEILPQCIRTFGHGNTVRVVTKFYHKSMRQDLLPWKHKSMGISPYFYRTEIRYSILITSSPAFFTNDECTYLHRV